MNLAFSLDQIWRSATFPMWLTLAAAGFFGLILLITLLRAEKSVANGALTVITLLAIAVAVAATIRGFDSGSRSASADIRSAQPVVAAPAALACIDDLAGDAVLNACEKVLFGSADSAAAAVAYAASQITRLTSFGDIATAERNTSPELQALRRAIERDRYGLMAYVLTIRDHCTPASCAAFGSLGTTQQIASNMDEHVYENLITRYAPSWNAPASASAAAAGAAVPGAGVLGALPPSVPTGKPTNAEFPSAANTPPVSIMTPEPAAKPPAAAAAAAPSAPPRAAPAASPAPPAAAKKQAAAKRPPPSAPVPIAPPPPASTAAPASSDD
ncbi:hypothetical protein [Bradyrhizobium cenepequi]|uniref:hypothetical protein n=1 Tax=Bradyrhizobium cenepequi TaxID=2821403 RepID=UPI001CE387EF|nr:hypothetical protein [Bradyrhizobium cenepequi]MCA6109674.1 hypothetical protein [Bradyrhizobium cenepequi]